jgi:hypothetical protein
MSARRVGMASCRWWQIELSIDVFADGNATTKQIAVTVDVVNPTHWWPVFDILQRCQREGTNFA